MSKPILQFLGAAQSVTGSKFLLTSGGRQILIECGLFQGMKELRLRNWSPMPVDPSKIDAVILTHAHLDHTGYIPRLVKQKFQGPVYCTPPTAELMGLLLPDSGHLQEEEAHYANRKGYSKHKPALPLYTKDEAERSLKFIRTVRYGKEFEVTKGIRARLIPSGHILGAAFVELAFEGKRLIISGDIGSYDRVVMDGPEPIPPGADYIMVESTYGGRRQDHRPIAEQLREKIRPVLEGNGVVVIPAFAVGRTTLVLYHLRQLQDAGEIPDVPVFVDSPMATDAVQIYCKFGNEHNLRVDLLSDASKCSILARRTHFVKAVEESKKLNAMPGPAIIISASGMATGGRILHHLRNRMHDPKNLILLVGYQAVGTRGRALLDGVKALRMFGEEIPVLAKVSAINGLSAHGDADDIIRWLKTSKPKPERTFLVHGEAEGLKAMGQRVEEELRYTFHVPQYLEKVTL